MLLGFLRRICRCIVGGTRTDRPQKANPGMSDEAAGEGKDDLTAIRGIGMAKGNRLNAAGIRTYEQMARTTPKALRKILGSLAVGARLETWIAKAKELAAAK